jgi:uncharacterized protein (TIGR02268 family)
VAVALWLVLTAPEEGKAWEADGAALVGPGGHELRVLPVWQEAPITPGQNVAKLVIVEAEAQGHEAQGTFTLKLWDRGGTRTVILDRVTFPQLPEPGPP